MMQRTFAIGLLLGALILAGIATVKMPNNAVVVGQVEAGIGRYSSNYIGFLTVTGLVNTVAGNATNMNTSAGRVRMVASAGAYYITNSLVTANSIVLATYNSDPAITLMIVATPSAGLITLTPGSGSSPDAPTDVAFLVVQP